MRLAAEAYLSRTGCFDMKFRSENDRQPQLFTDEQPQPTDAIPGSPEKIEVLRLRYLKGEDLWHKDDRVIYDDRKD